jgi:peptide/nickel transport system substrate-binding protein
MFPLKRVAAAAAASLFLVTSPAAQAQDDDPRPELTIAVGGLYRTMEPIEGNSTTGSRIHPNIYNALVGRNWLEDPEGTELAPELATDWEQVEPTLWRVTLREGVMFHNGEEMTAEDVAFSLSAERIWGEDALVPAGTRYTEGIVGVEAVDEYVVEIETNDPDPNLMYRFITPLGYIVPRDYYLEVGVEAYGQAPVGTGPYRVTDFDASDHITLEAFDDYWGGEPPAESLSFQIVPEFSARLAGMVSGEFDMMVDVPIDQVDVVEGYEQLEYRTMGIGNYVMAAFNTLSEEELPEFGPNPVADRYLRYAMVSAIDREALVDALWGDATFAPAPFNFPGFGRYYDPDIEPMFPYDPEAAQDYLEQSDYDGEEIVFNVTAGAYPNWDLAVEYMAEQWNAMGINVVLNVVDSWSLALQHPYGLLNMSMTTPFDGTPTRAIWGFWGPESARATRERDRNWVPPEEFVEEGRAFLAATDFEEKYEHFRNMVRIWEEVTPAIMMWRNVASWVHQDWIGWQPVADNRMFLGPGFLEIDYDAMPEDHP